MPLRVQMEGGEQPVRRLMRLPLWIVGGLAVILAVGLGAVCFSPAPLEIGPVILIGPSSSSQLVFYNGQLATGMPPGQYEVAYQSRSGKVSDRFWVAQVQIRWPFILLVR